MTLEEKKIEIKDLIIENWVYNDKKQVCKVYQINGIFDNYVEIDNYDEDDGTFEMTNDVYEIPLTPEFLEKNGFESMYADKSAYKCIVDSEYDYASVITIDLSHPKCSYVMNKKDNREYNGPILSVNELQKLLQVCKIEKEIVV